MKPVWISHTSNDTLPKNVVKLDDNTIVGRVWHEGSFVPATVDLVKSCAHICKNEREFIENIYEILIDNGYSWQSCEWKYFPLNSQDFKKHKKDPSIFIGYVKYKDVLRVGQVDPEQGVIAIPFEGKEVTLSSYDILIRDQSANWISARCFFTPSDAVVAGFENYDYTMSLNYVGRSLFKGKWHLTNVLPSLQRAYIEYENEIVYVRDYQLLCGHRYRWHKVYDHIPSNAVSIGTSPSGEPLYISRYPYLWDIILRTFSFDLKTKSLPDEILIEEF